MRENEVAHNFFRFYDDLTQRIEEQPSWFDSHGDDIKKEFERIGSKGGDQAVMRAMDKLERICADDDGYDEQATPEKLDEWMSWLSSYEGD